MTKKAKCYKCGNAMENAILIQHVVTTLNGHTIVCLDVPIDRCPECGEVYFSSTVAEIFDKIRRGVLYPDETAVVELPALSVHQVLAAV